MRPYSNRERPNHLGAFPLERLPRAPAIDFGTARLPEDVNPASSNSIATSALDYARIFRQCLDGATAPGLAPITNDFDARAHNLKASAYFFDAALAGCCLLTDADWTDPSHPSHTHALVFLVEFGREPNVGEPGAEWIRGSNVVRTVETCAMSRAQCCRHIEL